MSKLEGITKHAVFRTSDNVEHPSKEAAVAHQLALNSKATVESNFGEAIRAALAAGPVTEAQIVDFVAKGIALASAPKKRTPRAAGAKKRGPKAGTKLDGTPAKKRGPKPGSKRGKKGGNGTPPPPPVE